MTKGNARVARASEEVQRNGNDADDERSEKRGPESFHDEIRIEHPADKIKQQGVDHEREEAEGEDQ